MIRSGQLLDLNSYPVWAREMVGNCTSAKARVVNHALFREMRDATLTMPRTRSFLAGTWPTIEQFPQYMAMNLIKARYGVSRGQDMARRYLIRNLRAIEGATGKWTTLVYSTDAYEETFEPGIRKKAMKWLKSHAHYDDTHPWEALDTVCSILGHNPKVKQVNAIETAIKKSYYFMELNLDGCMGA